MRVLCVTSRPALRVHYPPSCCTAAETLPRCSLVAGVLEDMLAVLQAERESDGGPSPDPEFSGVEPGQAKEACVGPCSLQLLHALHGLMDCPQPCLRHRAFMLLRRLGGEPATLYRDIEDEDTGVAGDQRPRLIPCTMGSAHAGTFPVCGGAAVLCALLFGAVGGGLPVSLNPKP